MKSGHIYDQFQNQVQPALQSKIEELSLLGYGTVSESQLWGFLIKKKWKKPKEEIHLYEIVQEILSLDLGEFMNYQTVEALKSSQFSFQDEDEWKALMK